MAKAKPATADRKSLSMDQKFALATVSETVALSLGGFRCEINPREESRPVCPDGYSLDADFSAPNCDWFFLHQRDADFGDLRSFLLARSEHEWHGVAILRPEMQHPLYHDLVHHENANPFEQNQVAFFPKSPFEMELFGEAYLYQGPVMLVCWGAYFIDQLRLARLNGLLDGAVVNG